MEYDHKSVLLAEVVKQLRSKTGGTLVDCTLGGAGHARAILEHIGTESLFIGIDRDDTALAAAKIALENFSQQLLLVKGNFRDLDQLLKGKVDAVDGFLFDLGVSSIHFDIAERGFSYKKDGPLDMRMDKSQKLTAATIVNEYSNNELHQIIRDYGEERWASRIAQFIVEARERKPLESTLELVQVIKNAIPARARRKGPHPAKRTFQALRIAVNEELTALESALWQAIKWLNANGRIVVISYHSLEDRLVKRIFQKLEQGFICKPGFKDCEAFEKPLVKIITRKVIKPSVEEIARNRRARSAKLRVVEKL